MKRGFALFLCIILTAGLSACGEEKQTAKEYTYEIAMITPSSEESIDDGAQIEDTWEGIRKFAEENSKTYKYYEPADKTEAAGVETVTAASDAGATVVVGWGSDTAAIFEKAAESFPDLTFISINGNGGNHVSDVRCDSVAAGYLAGYAAVTEGYEDIGFLGESEMDRDYGFGFVQGCNAAAVEWGHTVSLRFFCGEKKSSSAQVQQLAADWYAEGTGLIAAAGKDILEPVKTAAEEQGGKVIGRSIDRLDETVIASSEENCALAAETMLKRFFSDGAAESTELGIPEKAVTLKWKEEQFSLFVKEDYQEVLSRFAEGKIKLLSAEDVNSVGNLIAEGNLYRIILMED